MQTSASCFQLSYKERKIVKYHWFVFTYFGDFAQIYQHTILNPGDWQKSVPSYIIQTQNSIQIW